MASTELIIGALDAAYDDALREESRILRGALIIGVRMAATEMAQRMGAANGGMALVDWMKHHPVESRR